MAKRHEIVEITDDHVSIDMLDNFERRQIVTQQYRMKNESKVLKKTDFVDDWTQEEKRQIVENYFINANKNLFYVSAIYFQNKIIGFMVLDCKPIGVNNEYAELKMLHVSKEHRNKGIGKALFKDAVRKGTELNFSKLYISANPSYETQMFYEQLGCRNALWLYPKAADLEPYDIQMEYTLTT